MAFEPSRHFVADLVETLRQARCAQGLSQVELDMHIGWADGQTSKYEAAMRGLTLGGLELWAAGLGCRVVVLPPLPFEAVRCWEGRVFSGQGGRWRPRDPKGSRSKVNANV